MGQLRTGNGSSPCRRLFLIVHRDHIPQIMIARSFREHISERISPAHVCGCNVGSLTPIKSFACSQKFFAIVHSISTCLIDSSSAPHTSQCGIDSMCLRWSTCLAARNRALPSTKTLVPSVAPQVSRFFSTHHQMMNSVALSPDVAFDFLVTYALSAQYTFRAFPVPKPRYHHHVLL